MRTDGGSAGRRGDFLTSPEVGPLFGAVLARYLDREWERLGRPDAFTVVDAGAGPGTLARSVLAAEPACAPAMRYVAVEISAAQRARHPDRVESRPRMPDGPFEGVIVANELLDNLPFRLAVFDNAWREAFVEVDRSGNATERLSRAVRSAAVGPADERRTWRPGSARRPGGSLGRRRAGSPRTRVARRRRLRRRAHRRVGRPAMEGVVADLSRATRAAEHYLQAPGSQDITIDVPFDQLPEPDTVRTQAQFLQLLGIEDLVDEGRRYWERARGSAGSRCDAHAQPDQRSGGTARPGWSRRLSRRRMARRMRCTGTCPVNVGLGSTGPA